MSEIDLDEIRKIQKKLMESVETSYLDDLETGFDTLPEDWRDHPRRFAKWGNKHANSMAERDRAKENLKVVEAELATQVRSNWDALGFEKAPTVDAVQHWVIQQPKYREASEEYINKCEEVNILSVGKSAFEHRRKQLESLTQFLLMGIISSTPKLQGTDDPHGDEIQQGIKPTTHKRIKRRLKT